MISLQPNQPGVLINIDDLRCLRFPEGGLDIEVRRQDVGRISGASVKWDHVASSGDIEVINMSDEVIFLVGWVEVRTSCSLEIAAKGWTAFTFVLGDPGGKAHSTYDYQYLPSLRVSRDCFTPPTVEPAGLLNGVSCLVRDDWLHLMDVDQDDLGNTALHAGDGLYLLSEPLRALTMAAIAPRGAQTRQALYRAAKGFELLLEATKLLARNELTPLTRATTLTNADTRRISDVRRLISEQYREPLTLQTLARACGLNRAKLTRGFRELYNCTIGEALAEERLLRAAHALANSDDPVSKVAFASGYRSNASFSRAFAKRHGMPPSRYRHAARGAVFCGGEHPVAQAA
jgi:AraC-like DNA-binding protein